MKTTEMLHAANCEIFARERREAVEVINNAYATGQCDKATRDWAIANQLDIEERRVEASAEFHGVDAAAFNAR